MLLGSVDVFLGLNLGFGGFLTLGWLGPSDFLEITNQHAYLVQDSHMRFYGGLYVGVGLFLILSATNLAKYRLALNLVFVLAFMGGLARLTMMRSDIIFGPNIIGSLMAELILMPILVFWLSRIVKLNTAR